MTGGTSITHPNRTLAKSATPASSDPSKGRWVKRPLRLLSPPVTGALWWNARQTGRGIPDISGEVLRWADVVKGPTRRWYVGDIVEAVRTIKTRRMGSWAIMGSGQLIILTMTAGLIDEYMLMIHPLALRSGGAHFRPRFDSRRAPRPEDF